MQKLYKYLLIILLFIPLFSVNGGGQTSETENITKVVTYDEVIKEREKTTSLFTKLRIEIYKRKLSNDSLVKDTLPSIKPSANKLLEKFFSDYAKKAG